MKFLPTPLMGVYLIELELKSDARGFFTRSYCREIFQHQGIEFDICQSNISYNHARGTLRGMHYQQWQKNEGETKLVRCTQGEVYDVIIDLRPNSPTYCRWTGTTLSSQNRHMLYIPQGCAHGFLTLCDHTELFYEMGQPYRPEAARGVRWNDPAFAIDWPLAPEICSEQDATWPDFIP